jgi:hypothetical protein
MAAGFSASAQVSATIDIATAGATALNSNFSGFNDEVVFPAEFFDYRLNNLAAQLTPGWVRYPSGSFSDAFNWQTGLMVPAWAGQFQGTNIATLLTEAVPWVNGKGGGSFVDGANRAAFLGAKLIVCVNGFTDTAQSAGQMAAFAKANHIPVAVWELANEPIPMPSWLFSSWTPAIPIRIRPGTSRSSATGRHTGMPSRIITILRRAAAPSASGWRTRTPCWRRRHRHM